MPQKSDQNQEKKKETIIVNSSDLNKLQVKKALKIVKWLVIIGVSIKLGLYIIQLLISVLSAFFSWLVSMFWLGVIIVVVYKTCLSPQARAKAKIKNAKWEEETKARFGISDQSGFEYQAQPRPEQKRYDRVYDAYDHTYRTVETDSHGNTRDDRGRSVDVRDHEIKN